MPNLDLAAIKADIDKARQTISDLCCQRQRWVMSIPPRHEVDPDLILGQVVQHGKALIAEVERLQAECFALAAHQCKHPSGDDYGNPVCEEVDRLRQQLATAKAEGAAEELERMAREDCYTVMDSDLPHVVDSHLEERASEIRKGIK